MMYQEEYKELQITIDTSSRPNGWAATYQIGVGRIQRAGDHQLPTEQLAYAEALSEAKLVIDNMAS